MLAIATGTRLLGLHSKSSSSTARRIAATGVANVAAIPAAAPATSSVVLSASVTCIHCAMSDPTAPPDMMIGPSAPKGPPIRSQSRLIWASTQRLWHLPSRGEAKLPRWPREFHAHESCLNRTGPSTLREGRQLLALSPSNIPAGYPLEKRAQCSSDGSRTSWLKVRYTVTAGLPEQSNRPQCRLRHLKEARLCDQP